MVKKLCESDMERILDVERRAFIPSIQTTEEVIKRRLSRGHIYLGVESENELVGTLAFRYAHFIPDFEDFIRKYPTFDDYAEKPNDSGANAVFVYSIGVVPNHRNAANARKLLDGALEETIKANMDFLVGDVRVPSYNGSHTNPDYEEFDENEELHSAIDNYFKTGVLPPKKLTMQDPVAGFFLKVLLELKVLGITDKNFWKGDEPCGGHMVIVYLKTK